MTEALNGQSSRPNKSWFATTAQRHTSPSHASSTSALALAYPIATQFRAGNLATAALLCGPSRRICATRWRNSAAIIRPAWPTTRSAAWARAWSFGASRSASGLRRRWLAHLLLFRGSGLASWIGLLVVLQNILSSLLDSHLFDFSEGWLYAIGVGVAGGMILGKSAKS